MSPIPTERDCRLAELEERVRVLETEIDLRTRAVQDLRRTRDQMAAFLESASVCLQWVGEDGTVLWANEAELDLLGYRLDEYIGRPISKFHADREVIEDILLRLGRDEKLRNYEATMVCKDGSTRTVLIDSNVLWEEGRFVHSQWFMRDVTEEKGVESVNRLLSAMVESCDDAVVSKDLNGVITSWNSGAQRVFGYTAAEAIGQSVTILIPENRHDEEPEVLRKIRSGQRIDHYETIRRRKDGELIDISLSVSPVYDSKGRIIGASKVARDITGAKRDQKQLNDLANELAKSRDRLEQRVEERTASLKEALAQLEEFSYTVSHDLRAPLRAMNMYAKILLENRESLSAIPEAEGYLERIKDNCSRLDQMIMDVLAFGRVAKDPIELKSISLDRVIAQIVENLPSLQPPHCEIELAELGQVLAHEASLSQAISNVLINAVKFVAEGVEPRIKIWMDHGGLRSRLWIEDNGIGIDPRLQQRLFGMFERLHPDLDYEGTGVGLAIVRKAILRMGGLVGVESDGKNGSRFWMEFASSEGN